MTVVAGIVYFGGLLVCANLGETSFPWRVAAYALLGGPLAVMGLVAVADLVVIGLVGPVTSPGAVSGSRQVFGGLLLLGAATLGLASLLPPVRAFAARLLPGFRPESGLHAVTLGLYWGLLLFFAYIQVSTDQLKQITQSGESPSVFFIVSTNQLPMLVLAVVGVGFLTRRRLLDTLHALGLYWPGKRWLLFSGLAAVGLVVFGAAFELMAAKVAPQQTREVQQASDQLLRNVNGYGAAITLALAAGIGEEILFRGALLPRIGNPLSALLFAALHAQYAISLATLEIFILGLVLGWLRRRAGTTGAIVAHSGYDMILLVLSVAFPGH